MKSVALILIAGALAAAAPKAARADDLTGSSMFLCTAVQATGCFESGVCEQDLPWNLNVPQFIQVDLTAKRMSTTKASNENRTTPIEVVKRDSGLIVLQGFERGRAFSFVIAEATGMATVAVATDGRAVVVFGACTTLDNPR